VSAIESFTEAWGSSENAEMGDKIIIADIITIHTKYFFMPHLLKTLPVNITTLAG
jgi:hypothetical protein